MLKNQFKTELKKPDTNVRKGDENEDVKRIQEWINLWKFYNSSWNLQIIIDSDFGPATDYAVRRFQVFNNLEDDGIVGPLTWKQLVKPMREAFEEIIFHSQSSLRDRITAYAHQQERANPTEINSNKGPWVRAYMDGNEGRDWYWCVGFVETVLDQAYSSLDKSYRDFFPDPSFYSCDKVLEHARENNRLVEKHKLMNREYIPQKGDLFLNMNPNNTNDATHIGIVLACDENVLTTIEGNTDDHIGSRNGGEVCKRTRDFGRHHIYVVKLE